MYIFNRQKPDYQYGVGENLTPLRPSGYSYYPDSAQVISGFSESEMRCEPLDIPCEQILCRRPAIRWRPKTLKVKFRRRYSDFRREVDRALRRWVSYKRDRGCRLDCLIKKVEDKPKQLKELHKTYATIFTDGDPVELNTFFGYRGRPRHYRVCEISWDIERFLLQNY